MLTRSTIIRSSLSAAAAALLLATATGCANMRAPEPAADAPGYTIVISLGAKPGKTREDVRAAADQLLALARQQPGLTYSSLLENMRPQNEPMFVMVTRWREQKDWGTLLTSETFNRLTLTQGEILSVQGGVFVPAKH